ncbi:conserved Plasmodium protein, unknown function [Plasmodium berghei]|uniref:Uncharacterized protein n=2 Tax=Plasmodium berghei TaxID=5821 RepID=A0A509AI24_PLABA|nr:conserved Plasmodium protein, unknown function [Plasmodium berghei ANKA]CXI41885.1 conserved Plasmodium protein, unknown function [Plasmodium berghei]SCM21999.1 conserved Plasmodium protein, unknown function [Plasmodium berghei]SCN25215.1 conserved Plasmodium protein, unknown function [Plasmodium berghei]SCO60209.1 conserved Plasmodium protein, unknown function [Plasmodium berghei]SCO61827.1 conserved Plasmodium protein, unknown function [Plasmodium berghei]|eukprot:XP_034421503.1 conserved Plasmodium protein, unknown function [Plasmodium berghei ANKA]
MENFFTKRVKDVFALIKSGNNKEINLKKNESMNNDKSKDTNLTEISLCEKKEEINNNTIISSKIEFENTKKKDNALDENKEDQNLHKKRKLTKLHYKENPNCIDNYIDIKRANNDNINHVINSTILKSSLKTESTSIDNDVITHKSATVSPTMGTSNICKFLVIKKNNTENIDNNKIGNVNNTIDNKTEITKNNKLNNSEENDDVEIISIIPNTCEMENEKKKINKINYIDKSSDEKENTSKKQKTNDTINNEKDNDNIIKNHINNKKVNRIDEMFKNLIMEQNEKKKKITQAQNNVQTESDNNNDQTLSPNDNKIINIFEEKQKKHDDVNNTISDNINYSHVTNIEINQTIENFEKQINEQIDEHKIINILENNENSYIQTENKSNQMGVHNCINISSPIKEENTTICVSVIQNGENKKNEKDDENQREIINMYNNIKENENNDADIINLSKEISKEYFENNSEESNIKKVENMINTSSLNFPDFAIDQSTKLINETNKFFNMYNLTLKIEHLPINLSSDMKILIEKKKYINTLINEYKDELKQRQNYERQQNFDKIEANKEKNEYANSSDVINEQKLLFSEPCNENNNINENNLDTKQCEIIADNNETHTIKDGENLENNNSTVNKPNKTNVNNNNNDAKKKKIEKKKQKKTSNKTEKNYNYDDLSYLNDTDKERVEKEHQNFLNILEEIIKNKINDQNEDNNKSELGNTFNHINEDNNTNFENKEKYIKDLIKELICNNDEKENYMKWKQIENEGLRFEKLKELIIDMKIKEKKIDVILSSNSNVFKYFNLYRQRYFLHEKMLINWNYVENSINKKNDIRNRNLPFQLLELDNALLENVQNCYDDILSDNFSGIMLTLNTKSFETNVDDNSIYLSKIICGCLIEYIDQLELNIKCIWAHPLLNAKSTYSILSAFLPRVILEAFLNNLTSATTLDKASSILNNENHKIEKTEMINNKNNIEENMNMIEERKEKKKNSFYNRLNKLKDSKNQNYKNDSTDTNDYITNEHTQYLKKFALYEYPAMYYLNFNKNCALMINDFSDNNKTPNDQSEQKCIKTQQNNNYSYPTYNENNEIIDKKNYDKFLYIIFSDIDIFPRQCYLLFCSYKYMCLNMHYETDTCYIHSDLNLKNIQKENIGKNTYLSNICPCSETKEDLSNLEDAGERIIGCTELYMYFMLPKKEEREGLGLLKRNGWRDLIPNTFEDDINENISNLLKIRTNITNLYNHINIQNKMYEKTYTTTYINKYEWCGLKMKDIRNAMNEDFNYESPKKNNSSI